MNGGEAVIQVFRLQAPGQIHKFCDICGSVEQLELCEAAGPRQPIPLRNGEHVTMFWKEGSRYGRRVRRVIPEWWMVNDMFYQKPPLTGFEMAQALVAAMSSCAAEGSISLSVPPFPKKKVHELMMRLTHLNAARERDAGSTITMPYSQFPLWQEGDIAKLEAAGLLDPPPVIPPKRSWWGRVVRRR